LGSKAGCHIATCATRSSRQTAEVFCRGALGVIYREIDAGQASQVFALLNWPAFQMIWKVAGSGRQSHFGFGAAVLVRAVLVRAVLVQAVLV
jgi:hypothetical protein